MEASNKQAEEDRKVSAETLNQRFGDDPAREVDVEGLVCMVADAVKDDLSEYRWQDIYNAIRELARQNAELRKENEELYASISSQP